MRLLAGKRRRLVTFIAGRFTYCVLNSTLADWSDLYFGLCFICSRPWPNWNATESALFIPGANLAKTMVPAIWKKGHICFEPRWQDG